MENCRNISPTLIDLRSNRAGARLGKGTALYTFHGTTDGAIPEGGVIRDASGNLYGITHNNGNSYGVVFAVDKGAKETVLPAFTGALTVRVQWAN